MFQTPTYQKVIKVAKPVLILVITLFVFFKLFYSYHINTLFTRFELNNTIGSWYYLAATIALLFFNWGIESYKWQLLINRFEPISFFTAVKAVLSGVTLSIITPNQIGDFAGRVIHLEVLNKIKGSLVTVIGHTAQVIVTLTFGLFSLRYFSDSIPAIKPWMPLGYVLIPISILGYLKLDWVYKHVAHWPYLKKVEKYIEVFGQYSIGTLSQLLTLSFLRYAVFLCQYFLLIRFFHVQIDWLPALACIVATFCVQSVFPSFLLLEIGLRGVSALYFFSMFSAQHEGILLAAYSLWMINMLVPGILGMYFIYKVRT